MSEQITAHEQALRDAREIGRMLKEKHNMQPAAIPEMGQDGVMRTQYVPPPSYGDISLADLGKQTLIY